MNAAIQTQSLNFRKAKSGDIKHIWEIILQAKSQMFLLKSKQWDEYYPSVEDIRGDIKAQNGYVLCLKKRIIAYGVIAFDGEPAYEEIDGKWRNSLPYVIVHRLAVTDDMKHQGIARLFMQQAEELSRSKGIYNFRIDTNYDNKYMLHLIASLGFKYSGKVLYRGNKERKAFEKCILPHSNVLPISGYTIREAIFEDAEAIYKAIDSNRDDLRTWLPFVDNLKNVKDEQIFLKSVQEVPYKERDLVFIINNNTEVCGLIGFHFSDLNNHRTEIGYWLLPAHRGKGVITEAVRFLCHLAFEEKDFNRIQIRCAVNNQDSNAIPQRLGFLKEGIERDGELLVSGQYTDINVYSLLKKEFNL